MVKAYMYFRVSTTDKGQRVENQEAEVLELHKELCPDAEIVKIYEEASAWQDNNRPKFQEAIRRFMADTDAKYFLAWDFDRIYRDRRKFVKLMRDMDEAGKIVATYRQKYMLALMNMPDSWIKDSMYNLLLNLYGEMAEDESRKRSDRVKAAYKSMGAKGRASWGRHSVDPKIVKRAIALKGENPDLSIRRIKWLLEGEGKKVSVGKLSEIFKENREKCSQNIQGV